MFRIVCFFIALLILVIAGCQSDNTSGRDITSSERSTIYVVDPQQVYSSKEYDHFITFLNLYADSTSTYRMIEHYCLDDLSKDYFPISPNFINIEDTI